MVDRPSEHIVCATYTHARRHPLVLGRIAGWTPPFQLSFPQLAVLGVTLWVEVHTWRWWAGLLPRSAAILVAVGIPCGAAWAVRRARVEGRSLVRAAVGWLNFLGSPPGGWVGGRPHRRGRAVHLGRHRTFLAAGEEDL